MAQHISQSKQYRNLSLIQIASTSDEEAWNMFVSMRWGNKEKISCPVCGAIDKHYFIRTRRQWRCKHCATTFSVTTGTPFQDRKLPFNKLLLLIYLFTTNPKGLPANKVLAEIGVTFRTAYVNIGKIREAIFQMMDLTPLTGLVQIDGMHCCGKPRRPRRRQKVTSAIANNRLRNRKASIVPHKRGTSIEPWNARKLEKRHIVMVLR